MTADNPSAQRRKSDAALVRASAYDAIVCRLRSGEITYPEAITAMRSACRRAARIERGQAQEEIAA